MRNRFWKSFTGKNLFSIAEISGVQNSLTYDEKAIAAGEWWRYLTAHLFFGMHQARLGAIVRYIIVGMNFLRYFYYMENYFFFRRKFQFITMIVVFLGAANAFASLNAVAGFYGDVLRMAIITAWSQIYYQVFLLRKSQL